MDVNDLTEWYREFPTQTIIHVCTSAEKKRPRKCQYLFLTEAVCHCRLASSWSYITNSSPKHRQAAAHLFHRTPSLHEALDVVCCSCILHMGWLNVTDFILIHYVRCRRYDICDSHLSIDSWDISVLDSLQISWNETRFLIPCLLSTSAKMCLYVCLA